MQLKIKSPEDFWSGLMFVAFGIAAMYMSRNYPMGSALRMGPGYFPTWLGGIMTFIGAIVFGRSFYLKGEGLTAWSFRPLLVLVFSIAFFGVCLDEIEIGFVPSLLILILGAAFAHDDVHWVEMILLAVLLTAGCIGIFIYGIGLPYKLFWWE